MRLRSRAPLGRAAKPRGFHHAARNLPLGCSREVEGYACPFVRPAPRRPIEDASAPVELDRRARKPFDHPLRAAETRSADSMQPTFQRRAPLLHEATGALDESELASRAGEPRRFNGARSASAGWSCRRARMFSIRAFALRADLWRPVAIRALPHANYGRRRCADDLDRFHRGRVERHRISRSRTPSIDKEPWQALR